MKNPPIDFFSDTKTRPSKGMIKAMMNAEVGDEQADEDPTTISLCDKVAELTGKEKALFMPSGTMCNQIALAVWCGAGDEIIAEKTAHIINFEAGGASVISRASTKSIDGKNGVFTAKQVESCLRAPFRHFPTSKLISIEQTSNLGGGKIWPLKVIKEIADLAKQRKILLHMDGARLMNAVVASNLTAKEYSAPMDSVWIDLSKGLGCPIGAVLAGPKHFIEEAWGWKQRLGGSMRQSGIIAAAGLYALENNVTRLAEDHENATLIAESLQEIKGIEIEPQNVDSNIVLFKVKSPKMSANKLSSLLLKRGIRIGAMGKTDIRIVTHLNVNRSNALECVENIKDLMVQA